VLFEKFSQPQSGFEELLPRLNLESTSVTATENREQHIETSIFVLGALRCAALCCAASCCFLLR